MESKNRKLVSYLPYLLIPVVLIASMWMLSSQAKDSTRKVYYEIVQMFEEDKIVVMTYAKFGMLADQYKTFG